MHLAFARLTAFSAAAAIAAMLALPCAASAGSPTAGPWYTSKELKALIAYSNASFAHKKQLLAEAPAGSTVHPWPVYPLTPRERRNLERYANASFADKQRILAGAPEATSPPTNFDWRAAAAALGILLIAAGAASRLVSVRPRRQTV